MMVQSDFLGEALIGLTDSLRLDMHIERVFRPAVFTYVGLVTLPAMWIAYVLADRKHYQPLSTETLAGN